MNALNQSTIQKIYTAVFFLLVFFLIVFDIGLRFWKIPALDQKIHDEQLAIDQIRAKSSSFLTPELKTIFEQYSESMTAVDSVLNARAYVFTGDLSGKKDPLIILDLLKFFSGLEKVLGRNTVLSNFSIDSVGKVNFLVQTKSYRDAAMQMKALPSFLTDVEISSVSRQPLLGSSKELPAVFKNADAVYSFIVQARVHPDFK